ncbi:MAG: 30S ribosomal protein S16 [Elusimicrobia bacterium]|nr:30S ribosomal protein S16 [Elusimicrobiota bacterium]
MAVKIRLKRTGRHKMPHYRVVAIDSRKRRDGRVLEELGHYHPTESAPNATLNMERVEAWISNGAQMTDTVRSIYRNLKKSATQEEEVKTEAPVKKEAPAKKEAAEKKEAAVKEEVSAEEEAPAKEEPAEKEEVSPKKEEETEEK